MDKVKIIKRIKKLLHLADTAKNSNVEEAASAAAKAQALIEKYRIEQALLNSSEQDDISWQLLIDKGKPEDWKLFLAGTLAKHNGSYIVKSPTYSADGQVWFVGEPVDIQASQELYTYIVNELNRFCIAELIKFKLANNIYPQSSFTQSYYVGAITTVDDRLLEATQLTRQEVVSGSSQDKAKLEKLQVALEKLDSKSEIAKQWVKDKFNVNFQNVSIKNTNVDGFTAGQEAGKKLNLDPKRAQLKTDKK